VPRKVCRHPPPSSWPPPTLRTRFVAWKYLSTLIVAAAFLAVPVARAISLRPSAAIPLLTGILFLTAASTALGIVSANTKTFIVLFLTFWYVAMREAWWGHTFALRSKSEGVTPWVSGFLR